MSGLIIQTCTKAEGWLTALDDPFDMNSTRSSCIHKVKVVIEVAAEAMQPHGFICHT